MAPSKSVAARRKELERAKQRLEQTQQPLEYDETEFIHVVTTTAGASTSSISHMPLQPQPLQFRESLPPITIPIPSINPLQNDTHDDVFREEMPPTNKPTQVSVTLQEFQNSLPELEDLIFEQSADLTVGNPCACNVVNARKTTRCYDCTSYEISCSECFIRFHQGLPFHWPEVWDFKTGFFVRHDLATLAPDIASINLGHAGHPCPSRHAQNHFFTAVHTNGIHKTKIRFCQCRGESRMQQLMRARLFPATINQPATAFTFQVLHQFHIHHLESKESVHDFIISLRRLTDNVFPQNTPDVTMQFRTVIRIWRLLKANKRLGLAQGIQKLLPHRRPLIVHCPVCPDPRVNMEEGWQNTPIDLCHLNQTQFTADGNHHSNRYLKNTDPDDISLYDGNAYFPRDAEYKAYVKALPSKSLEKTPCDHLTAISAQDRKKFKNMDITGIVTINCSHIVIKSTVDLQLGEKFANTDYALSHAICNTKPEASKMALIDHDFALKCDHRTSYDISCGFSKHVVERFEANFPNEADFIRKTKWLIPLLHVQNHRDNCTYLYSSAYQENAGHFQGESAEQPWIELNQLAPQTRQMNNGHRQDTIIDHHSHWNWSKTTNMAATLARDISRAKDLFDEKFLAFQTLCKLYDNKILEWDKLDRTKRIVVGTEVQCVYRQSESQVPSRARIFEALIADLDISKTNKTAIRTAAPSFINEGISILEEQRKLQAHVNDVTNGILRVDVMKTQAERQKALAADIEVKRRRLDTRLKKWRKLQREICPQLGDLLATEAISGKHADTPERETLFLPSDFTQKRREELQLNSLSQIEYKLQEGIACDAIQKLRTIVKLYNALAIDKKAESTGQKQNTRANAQLNEVQRRRDQAILDYSLARQRMIKLNFLPENSDVFPPLTVKDTFRKPTNLKRSLGDSRQIDGTIWTRPATGIKSPIGARVAAASTSQIVSPIRFPLYGTQSVNTQPVSPGHFRGTRVKGRKRKHEHMADSDDEDNFQTTKDGWIWCFRPREQMSDTDIENWMSEGEQVQWFRAEADMQRWQEEWETKQADFMRCIRTFHHMTNVWEQLGKHPTSNGRVAYAKRQAAMYQQLEMDARLLLTAIGYEDLLKITSNEELIVHIRKWRQKCTIPGLQMYCSSVNY